MVLFGLQKLKHLEHDFPVTCLTKICELASKNQAFDLLDI
jgi:hypothetical protein